MQMAKLVRREYWESRRDNYYDLFLHYSLVRMEILVLLIPLGVLVTIQGIAAAGILLIGIAVPLNWIFGAWGLNSQVNYENLREWLKGQTKLLVDEDGTGDKIHPIASPYFRVFLLGDAPLKISDLSGLHTGWRNSLIKNGEIKLGEEWKSKEPLIQWTIIVTLVALLIIFVLN